MILPSQGNLLPTLDKDNLHEGKQAVRRIDEIHARPGQLDSVVVHVGDDPRAVEVGSGTLVGDGPGLGGQEAPAGLVGPDVGEPEAAAWLIVACCLKPSQRQESES